MPEENGKNRSIFDLLRGPSPMVAGVALVYLGFFGTLQIITRSQDMRTADPSYIVIVSVGVLLLATITLFGCRIILANFTVRKEVIPQEDRVMLTSLIQGEKEKAIDLYVKLSSLAGATGTATKLGLTGLPLATI